MRFCSLIILLWSCLLIDFRVVLAEGVTPTLSWQEPAPGFEISQVQLSRNALFSGNLVVIRADLRRFRPVVIRSIEQGARRSDVKTMGESHHAWAAINANFFDEHGEPLGLVISRGNLIHDVHRSGSVLSGLFVADRTGAHVISRQEFSPKRALEGIQAGPRLVSDSKPIEGLRNADSVSRRSAVCLTNSNEIIFIASASRFDLLSLGELQQLLLHSEFRCVAALNLDGGGSSQFYVRSFEGIPQTVIAGDDLIPVALGLVPR